MASAAVACAVALVAAVVWAAARPAAGTDGTGAAHRAHTTASPAHRWTPTPTPVSGKGLLTLRSAPNVFYLPRYSPYDVAPYVPDYDIALAASNASPGGGSGAVGKVEVDLDLAAFEGKAEIRHVRKDYGCVRTGFHVRCAPGDVRFGGFTEFVPFSLLPRPNSASGPAGVIRMTVRAANAPAVHHTTRLIVGMPYLTLRQDNTKLTGVRPGDAMRLTPAFGNKGDTGVDGGISVVVRAQSATLPLRYANCRYDKAVGATQAQCDFPGPLPAGAAYETDGPVTALADRTARSGLVQYSVWRTVDMSYLSRLPESAPRGTGAPLRLRPVDGGAFTGDEADRSEVASGGRLSFETTQVDDVAAVGFTIKGKVGRTADLTVPYPKGDGWPGPGGRGTLWVTLPPGVSLVEVPPEEHESDIPYCYPSPKKDGTVACPGPAPAGTGLRVRIDKRVEGARGSVRVTSDSALDPNQANNTAPVTVEYLP
ncbi:hypothetical protein ACH4UM_06190 [Streptomyces sp. NPDC020801]|uniref:hypothetical protein n=1 Tax=Streptomyces sp. NPDC020801 TaxID=3365093 RepID=UPI0037872E88